jgi:hypothetical protein
VGSGGGVMPGGGTNGRKLPMASTSGTLRLAVPAGVVMSALIATVMAGSALLSAWPVICLTMTATPCTVWRSTASTCQAIAGAFAGTAP